MSVTARRVALLIGVVVSVFAVAALLATGLGRDPASAASPLVGRSAPDIRLPGLDGPDVALTSLRGQVVVVNFWASWCAECRTEQPDLDAVWDRFRDSGVVVLGVNFQDEAGDARDYREAAGTTYPTVVDTDSSAALAFGLRGVPETFLVDQQGRVVERIIGPVSAQRLGQRITELLGTGTP